MKIVDDEVRAVIAQPDDDGWYLRLQAPSMLMEQPDEPDHIWYGMQKGFWGVVPPSKQVELETEYQTARNLQ